MRIDDHDAGELLEALSSPPSCDMADEASLPARLGNLLLDRAEYIDALKLVQAAIEDIECLPPQWECPWCHAQKAEDHQPDCSVGNALVLIRKVLGVS